MKLDKDGMPVHGYLYILKCGEFDIYKVGFTGSLKLRVRDLQTSSPFKLKKIACMAGDSEDEKDLHDLLLLAGIQRMCGEWFKISDEDIKKLTDSLNIKDWDEEERK